MEYNEYMSKVKSKLEKNGRRIDYKHMWGVS